MKKVYIVNGSEDGNLGVYSNIKLAYEAASQYLTSDGSTVSLSYSIVLKKLKECMAVRIDRKESSYCSASIELFYLNEKLES